MTFTNSPALFVIGMGTFCLYLISVPFCVYRYFVILFVKLFRPKFGKILCPISTPFIEDFEADPRNFSVVTTMKLKGNIGISQLRKIVVKNVLNARALDKWGQSILRYPELKQYQVDFMCYRFWKQETHFEINDHVFEKIVSEMASLDEETITEEILNQTFRKERSPWEMVLFKHVDENSENVVLVLRIHHTLGDGKSILKLLVEGLNDGSLKTAEAVAIENRNWLKLFLEFLSYPFQNSWTFFKLFVYNLQTREHPLRVRNYSQDKSLVIVTFSRKIPLQEMRSITKTNDVRMSSVILSVITGAIGECVRGSKALSSLPVYYTLPKDGHPAQLRNHFRVGIMELPVVIKCPFTRLRKCNYLYNKLAESSAPDAFYQSVLLLSNLGKIVGQVSFPDLLPVVVTNLAGPEEFFRVGETTCTDQRMSLGLTRSSLGLTCVIFSYAHSIRFSVIAAESVMTKQETREVVKAIEAGILALSKNNIISQ